MQTNYSALNKFVQPSAAYCTAYTAAVILICSKQNKFFPVLMHFLPSGKAFIQLQCHTCQQTHAKHASWELIK